MPDIDLWAETIRQVPALAVLAGMVFVVLRHLTKKDTRHDQMQAAAHRRYSADLKMVVEDSAKKHTETLAMAKEVVAAFRDAITTLVGNNREP